MKNNLIYETNFPNLKLFKKGKVRDVYDLGTELLLVATDRLSAFDVVLPDPIPNKGKVLTALSVFWFHKTKNILKNHLISAEVREFPVETRDYHLDLAGRAMLVKKTEPVLVECVVRGYLAGSAFKEYQKTSQVAGQPLPKGLKESEKLAKPIFTPAIKASTGHDENISFKEAGDLVGAEIAQILKEKSLKIYQFARDYAEKRGIILADTKFEFGFDKDEIILIDEILTPDSSRFWPADSYQPGGAPPSFDKQFVRDYLETLAWDKTPPGPHLPKEVIEKTSQKYLEAFEKISGQKLQ